MLHMWLLSFTCLNWEWLAYRRNFISLQDMQAFHNGTLLRFIQLLLFTSSFCFVPKQKTYILSCMLSCISSCEFYFFFIFFFFLLWILMSLFKAWVRYHHLWEGEMLCIFLQHLLWHSYLDEWMKPHIHRAPNWQASHSINYPLWNC